MPDGALRTRLVGHTGVVTAVALTAGARHALAGGVDGAIRLWEVDTGRLVATLRAHATRVTSLALSPDGERLVSTDESGAVRIWDLAPERRSAAEIAARVATGSPFRIDADGRLRARDGSPR
jgi:WD40 repeat protein